MPKILMGVGAIGTLAGLVISGAARPFAFGYLLAYMMCLSVALGSLFLVIVHHLFDAEWSVPIRRVCEHISCLLFPWMGLLFFPIWWERKTLYAWMSVDPSLDHALKVKEALFNEPTWTFVSIVLFFVWGWLSRGLRKASLEQDVSGAAECTSRMRRLAAIGIFVFAFSLTLAAILWVKGLQHQWFSTMYGVYYFAESVWVTLATVYLIALLLKQWGPLKDVARDNLFHSIGVLLFAFTVFYSYIHFSQYFLILNANIPEETFWYSQRDNESWRNIGLILVFGHFFIPFLMLLRSDWKLNPSLMIPLIAYVWAIHYFDITFNVTPVVSPEAFRPSLFEFTSLALILGVMSWRFAIRFHQHPPYPQRDPRIAETMGVYVQPLSESHSDGTA